MTTKQVLLAHLEKIGVRRPSDPSAAIYRDSWFRIAIGSQSIPIFPLWGLRRSLTLHDIHHLVTGYPTTIRGELEIAGWELGSGGCARHLYMWIDRFLTFAFGLLVAPIATSQALRRGAHHRNLYRLNADRVLSMEFDEVLRFVGPPKPSGR